MLMAALGGYIAYQNSSSSDADDMREKKKRTSRVIIRASLSDLSADVPLIMFTFSFGLVLRLFFRHFKLLMTE